MPARLKIIVAYDGARFAGWQSQSHSNTIQDHLEVAFRSINDGVSIRVHGAGRTDAGVHSLGQVAHVDVPDYRFTGPRWTSALNALLPPEIRVVRASYVSPKFHARFSARGKVYRYRIWNGAVLPPFEARRAWHISSALDLQTLDLAAQRFVGQHDFASFAANRGKREESTVRLIRSVVVRRAGKSVALEFDGDGFLYKMVRMMVGALVRVALGKSSEEEIVTRLAAPSPSIMRARFAAPADGLYLVRVRY